MAVSRESFGTDREGRNVEKLTLRRDGLEAEIITFGAALREAAESGVGVYAYDCLVTPDSLAIRRPVEAVL